MASATAVQSPHKCMSACIEQNSPSLVIPPRIAFSAIESMSCRRIQFFVDGSISTLKGLPQPSHSNAARITEMLMSATPARSEEHTSELQSLMRISYAVFCLKKKKNKTITKESNISYYIHRYTIIQ